MEGEGLEKEKRQRNGRKRRREEEEEEGGRDRMRRAESFSSYRVPLSQLLSGELAPQP